MGSYPRLNMDVGVQHLGGRMTMRDNGSLLEERHTNWGALTDAWQAAREGGQHCQELGRL